MRSGGQLLPEVIIPSPIALTAGAALVVILALACLLARRRRDPVGRALTAHTTALSALRDSTLRATSTVAPSTADQPGAFGVTIVTNRPDQHDEVVDPGSSPGPGADGEPTT